MSYVVLSYIDRLSQQQLSLLSVKAQDFSGDRYI